MYTIILNTIKFKPDTLRDQTMMCFSGGITHFFFFFMGYFLNAGKTHHPINFYNVSNNSIIYDDALSNKNKIFKAIELQFFLLYTRSYIKT